MLISGEHYIFTKMESIQTLNYYLCMFQFYGKIVLVTVYIGSAVNCQFLCFFTIAQASGLTI